MTVRLEFTETSVGADCGVPLLPIVTSYVKRTFYLDITTPFFRLSFVLPLYFPPFFTDTPPTVVLKHATTNTTMSAKLITNVDERSQRTTKFPPEFNVKVDMRKVNVPLIKSWVQSEIFNILHNDDDVVVQLIHNKLEQSHYVSADLRSR